MVFGILAYVFSTVFDIFVYFDALREKVVSTASAQWITKILYFAFPQWGSTWFYSASFVNDFFSQSMSFWPVAHTVLYLCLIWTLDGICLLDERNSNYRPITSATAPHGRPGNKTAICGKS